ncbi:MAG: DNA mismatch repair endonuclease MutL [Microcystis sp. LE17-20D]|uniref:DNA mismatch repair endonuclease MutL n=1 Tax=Microcystis sp. TaxID=1127 RepID=UPI0022BBB79D|nr:DNA mismatch repair endonuclease MutL [Microcystis sp. LE17-20D]MCZ8068008.1 DNA mismatch repair endonuclease MutL [Microcystis sp. LE17-20D]MCZ8163592.1 DNA mismatch repair endonuclease MutL [Microcystis sp. LE19-196.1B]MCZ8274252.1 DNA mismatch repair endonuclease MutL [Microcystis sp. LE19-4.1E]
MTLPIQVLPQDVIDLIAAGEVIDSLGAVVRELVENAIDAGADRITIDISPQNWRIQVSDNGRGMSREDLQLCSYAHSTSKIRQRDDLWQITSLGFRGEALHSIAQVARLRVASRHDDDLGCYCLYNHQGEPDNLETIPIAIGTIVTVENLFSNFPVRRQALPSINKQLKDIQTLIHNFALCHPQITWQVFQDHQDWLRISPGKDASQILPQLVKSLHFNDLAALKLDLTTPDAELAQIELVIGLPDRISRHQPDWVKIAVNGRMVRSSELEQAIFKAFARTVPKDRYPVCFLHLHLNPRSIDWNRHPAKAEIYLHNLIFWQEQIISAIDKALGLNPEHIPEKAQNQRVSQILKAAEEKSTYTIGEKSRKNRLELKALAQIHQTYIVAEHPNGLWLVEQHIAHERVLYERLEDNWEIVPLDTPIILNQLTTRQVEQLQRLGLEVASFGDRSWAIRSIPVLLKEREDRADALLELSLGGDLQTAQVATACRSAIRNGTALSLEEMQNLLDDWQNTRNPRTCPHGRPIYLSLEETSLARFFRRHWVIGKSHGI